MLVIIGNTKLRWMVVGEYHNVTEFTRPLLVIKPHLPLGTLPDRDAELPIPQNEVQLSVPPVNSGGILP